MQEINSQSSEEVLLYGLKKGSMQHYRAIYDRYWKVLYVHAYKRLGIAELSEELVQDIFIDLWQRKQTLTIEKTLEAYLIGSMKKQVLFQLRKRYSQEKHYEAVMTMADQSDNSMEQRIIQRDLLEKIDILVQQLPDRSRQVFEMSRKQALSNREIAEQLQISNKTVEYHIDYALRYLRANCREYAMLLSIVSTIEI